MHATDPTFGSIVPLLLCLAAAYALGCLNSGYYLVRWKTGQDLRSAGSGNAGSKNVGRILGPWGFGTALLGDMLKGALAVQVARLLDLPSAAGPLAVIAVTIGHNWPAQLGFRGGKGVAASFGALLAFDPILAGLMLALCAAFLAASRRFTLSAAFAYVACPALAALCGYDGTVIVPLVLVAALVVIPHRGNLRHELTQEPA